MIDPSPSKRYQIVVVGSGFGSSFYLHEALARLPASARCLVLERGRLLTPEWQRQHQRNSDIDADTAIERPPGHKHWQFTIAHGGGTNCWWGVTPRLHPSDFQLRSRYGVGRDWPIDYAELEPWYARAEAIMAVAGPGDNQQQFPRSTPYPQPPHRLSSADRLLKAAMPGLHFALPSARASVPTAGRGLCCGRGRCNLCPVEARFSVHNGMHAAYEDPRVELRTDAEVIGLLAEAGRLTRVVYRQGGREHEAAADQVILGANAIFSAEILLRSGFDDGITGRHLHEQLAYAVEAWVDGLDHFDGGTASTGINYALFDGPHRASAGAVHMIVRNQPEHGLRLEPGRWRQVVPLLLVAEALPRPENRVELGPAGRPPRVLHAQTCAYAKAGIDRALAALPALLKPLPVERIVVHGPRAHEAHLQGRLPMGRDPADSVVDPQGRHHRLRNLVVVGTAVMPSCGTANPSLTAAALALRSAAATL